MSRKVLPQAIFAVLANLFAIGWMIYARWTVFTVCFVFWAESAIIGVVTLGKMLAALPGYDPVPGRSVQYLRGDQETSAKWSMTQSRGLNLTLGLVAFYGGFLAIMGVLMGGFLGGLSGARFSASLADLRSHTGGVAIVLLLLLAEHVAAAWFDFIDAPDWARHDPLFHVGRIWGRAIGLYLLIFPAVFIAGWLPAGRVFTAVFLAVFIAIKTLVEVLAIDLKSRGQWRRRFPDEED